MPRSQLRGSGKRSAYPRPKTYRSSLTIPHTLPIPPDQGALAGAPPPEGADCRSRVDLRTFALTVRLRVRTWVKVPGDRILKRAVLPKILRGAVTDRTAIS
jgi:hypothetical protein